MVIEAGSELTLSAGGSFIHISPAGISLSGPGIKLNAGGSPGKGSGAAPKLPEASAHVDKALTGEQNSGASSNPQLSTTVPSEPGSRQLIVDAWGDPDLGGQVTILDPEEQA
ncbi:hypothetical protein C2846_18365 [Pseudomonas jilinensis]|uniref:Type VI secretion system tip protein VgrG n=1 Tax=Pseudomonas jilinensis TaxID=2078689 RepID=A0A396RTS5_9PSED|nr:hypothetical protein C2846_18365 [Pseudomonas jilinensis]